MTEENQDNPEVEDSQEVMNQRHANHPTLTKLWSSAIISKTYVQGARQWWLKALYCSDSVIVIITEGSRFYWISRYASNGTTSATSATPFNWFNTENKNVKTKMSLFSHCVGVGFVFVLLFWRSWGNSFSNPLKNSRHTSSKSLCPDRVVLFNLRSFKAVVWLHNCRGWWQFFVRHTLISLHTGSTKLFFPSFAGGAFHDTTLRWFCRKKEGRLHFDWLELKDVWLHS